MSGAPPPIPSVETQRLLLRAIQTEDLDAYHSRLFADRDNVASCKVMEHLGMENHGPIRIFEMDALRYSIDLDRFREHERETSSLG